MLVEPEYCLEESLLLGVGNNGILKVGTNGKAMTYARIEVDLVSRLDIG
jgi:hypothetical protein